jgi:hypothetical protein
MLRIASPNGAVRAGALSVAGFLAASVVGEARGRAAEHSAIRDVGDHPSYIFEAEPHFLIGFAGPFADHDNFGLGFRGTFHIANGFVSSINDTVGVGVGFDFAPGAGDVYVPIVLQWNFWLSTHWSVFGEPGIAFGSGHGDQNVFPALFVGGRYNFTDRIALTMRVGYPEFSIGLSIFL